VRGRILVIDEMVPAPDYDSGSASIFSYLQILAKSGFGVTFAAAKHVRAERYTRALKKLGINVAPKWMSLSDVIETFGPRSDVLLLYRAHVAISVFDLARCVAPAAKIVFHPVDLYFLRLQREAILTGDRAQADSAQTMRAVELDLVQRADTTIVVSTYEATLLKELVPEAVVHQAPILREIPQQPSGMLAWRQFYRRLSRKVFNALAPYPEHRDTSFVRRRDFLFIGSFSHTPNVDAVKWFLHEVWPRIQVKGFRDRFIIVGSYVPKEIAALASDGIEVRGHVQNLAPLFAACRLSIAPLRYGAGIKGKIVTSLSFGVPIVATSIAAEGMGLRHGETILVADTPDAMADQIVKLYNDADLWERLSSNGYQAFLSKFSIAQGSHKVLAIFDGLIGEKRVELQSHR